ncbi:hypothetical protein ACK8P5_26700 (plasmid) [Paenibacillus sp. EC2-1]|uniref:hypothetical protein n=1 Tax=Paenibacillus sp. EC2-1 TaxID=3388665 RepID=UPI003BEF495E
MSVMIKCDVCTEEEKKQKVKLYLSHPIISKELSRYNNVEIECMIHGKGQVREVG